MGIEAVGCWGSSDILGTAEDGGRSEVDEIDKDEVEAVSASLASAGVRRDITGECGTGEDDEGVDRPAGEGKPDDSIETPDDVPKNAGEMAGVIRADGVCPRI